MKTSQLADIGVVVQSWAALYGTTDMDGKVFILLNEPDGATVTLTLAKVGYQGWTKQFRGEPAKPYTVCLQPAPL